MFACHHAQSGSGGKGSGHSSADNCLTVDGRDLGAPRNCTTPDRSVRYEGRFTFKRGETALVELCVAFDRFGLLDLGVEPRTDLTKGVVALEILLLNFGGSCPDRFPMDPRPDIRCAMKIGGRNPRVRHGTDLLDRLSRMTEKRGTRYSSTSIVCESGVFGAANFATDLVVPGASFVRHIPGRLPTAIVGKGWICLPDDAIPVALHHAYVNVAPEWNRKSGFRRVADHSFHFYDLPGTIEVAIRNDHGTVICRGSSLLIS